MQVMNLVDDRDIWIMYSQFLVYEDSPGNEQSTFIISAFWDKDSPTTTLWFIKEIVQNKHSQAFKNCVWVCEREGEWHTSLFLRLYNTLARHMRS